MRLLPLRPTASLSLTLALIWGAGLAHAAGVPRPEHPTPDAVRPHWQNLNGSWEFRFDPKDEGRDAGWHKPGAAGFDRTIVVPFPWESELSGIKETDRKNRVGWYRRTFEVPASFPVGGRVWLRFGAVDWEAEVWVNGQSVAKHEGGYTPFEADITDALKADAGKPAEVVVRVFDPTDPELPTGKQVGWYTPSSGIWQTVWLESRPKSYVSDFYVTTTIDPAKADMALQIAGVVPGRYKVALRSKDATVKAEPTEVTVAEGTATVLGEVVARVDKPRLWSPEDPHLYDVTLTVTAPDGSVDEIDTYFGLRTIARGKYGDSPQERILLNGKPVYLRLALDQSFNPKGIYTAPDDDFLKRDLLLARYNGLNGLRIHIKPDEPRRLYWADKMGLLLFEDMPNTWRQSPRARKAWEQTMREAVVRDRNHPSIIAWVAFNETWGLGSPEQYKADRDTQGWVGRMVDAIRKLDGSRLVEDNSPCNYDHVENTDLNSWHFYIDDHAAAARHVAEVVRQTEPGSGFNYCPGWKQGTAPLINSEYGGVSAGGGDRDVSWSFRDLTTLLRRQPKIQGYVYTELTDIEWEHNGFADYDRSLKQFGYDAFIPDMRPNELNGADFIGYGGPPALVVEPGAEVTVPVFLSHYSDKGYRPVVRWWVAGWTDDAQFLNVVEPRSVPATWKAYDVTEQAPLTFRAPNRPFVGSINITLRDEQNRRWAANYVNLVVRPRSPLPRVAARENEATLRFAPGDFSRKRWSGPSASPEGKVHGQGRGFYEYTLKVPEAVVKARPERFFFRAELAAKAGRQKVDWPERTNAQDYPQTDARKWPTSVDISINGQVVQKVALDDDPADARGVLSHLRGVEHGSYGELVEAAGPLSDEAKAALAAGQPLVIRLSVPDVGLPAGGLAVFGADTGQFPFDPTLVLGTADPLPADLGVNPGAPVAVNRMADRHVTLLATGESSNPPTWRYTTREPGEGWTGADFDDAGWQSGPAGFGTEGTPAVRVRTPWNDRRIWLRTSVNLPKLGSADELVARLFHDEDVEVFVNGRRLTRARGYLTAYRDIPLSSEQKGLFREGPNTIAVSCRQSGGGQGVDLGLTLQKGE